MWTLRIRIIWHRSQKSRIQRGRSATTSGGVLEAYSSQKPQFAMVRLSMSKGLSNNAWRERPKVIPIPALVAVYMDGKRGWQKPTKNRRDWRER